jgi:hypothetical protein
MCNACETELLSITLTSLRSPFVNISDSWIVRNRSVQSIWDVSPCLLSPSYLLGSSEEPVVDIEEVFFNWPHADACSRTAHSVSMLLIICSRCHRSSEAQSEHPRLCHDQPTIHWAAGLYTMQTHLGRLILLTPVMDFTQQYAAGAVNWLASAWILSLFWLASGSALRRSLQRFIDHLLALDLAPQAEKRWWSKILVTTCCSALGRSNAEIIWESLFLYPRTVYLGSSAQREWAIRSCLLLNKRKPKTSE